MVLMIIGLALILLEFAARGWNLLWLGIGSIAAGLAGFLVGDPHWSTQIVLLCACLIMSLAVGRAWTSKSAPLASENRNRALGLYLGRQAEVKVPITGGVGKIKLDNKYYTARGPDLPKGALVEITGFDKSGFTVIKANTNLD